MLSWFLQSGRVAGTLPFLKEVFVTAPIRFSIPSLAAFSSQMKQESNSQVMEELGSQSPVLKIPSLQHLPQGVTSIILLDSVHLVLLRARVGTILFRMCLSRLWQFYLIGFSSLSFLTRDQHTLNSSAASQHSTDAERAENSFCLATLIAAAQAQI